MADDIEVKIEREVAFLLKGWKDVTEPFQDHEEKRYEEDKIDAIRIARERAITGLFECPENIPPKEHYGALEPEERVEVESGS